EVAALTTWTLPGMAGSLRMTRLLAVAVIWTASVVVHSSALARMLPLSPPPATRTLPLPSSVAVCLSRAVVMVPSADQELLGGSYSSALLTFLPPATRTLPLCSSVAEWSPRPMIMAAAEDQELLPGSYRSAADREWRVMPSK